MMMKRIAVFCGSSPGRLPEYQLAARQLGKVLVEKNLELVYGGGKVGLMGEIAKTVHGLGGRVIGVIPESLEKKELAYKDIDDLRVVKSMHERKALISELSDAYVAMPGGFGTIEEIFEVLTWAQLGFHKKPCGFLNTKNYFSELIDFIEHSMDQEFIERDFKSIILCDEDPLKLIRKFEIYEAPEIDKAELALIKTQNNNK